MLKGIRKKLISVVTASAMVINLMPIFTLTAHAASVAGTLTFSGADTGGAMISIAPIVHDNEININGMSSSDIPSIQMDIFAAMSVDNAKNNITSGNMYYIKAEGYNVDGIGNDDASNGKIIVIKSSDGTDFSFKSIEMNDFDGMNFSLQIEGFRNGVSTKSDILDLSSGYKTFSLGTELASAKFQNVDEVRITNLNGGNMATPVTALFNNIQIGDPIIPAPTVSNLSITGTAQVGQTLTGIYAFKTYADDPADKSTYQWYRAKSATGEGAVAISGAMSKTYTLTTFDIDQDSDTNEVYIGLKVTPNDGIASGTAVTTTTYVGPITNSNTQHNYIVTNTNDSGTGSLRWAIQQAGLYGNGNITFDSSLKGSTITLASDLTTWDTSEDIFGQSRYSGAQLNDFSGNFTLTGLIDASGAPAITINGGGHVGIWASGSGTFGISNLKFTNFALNSVDGKYDGFGAAVSTGEGYAHVNLYNLIFDRNASHTKEYSGIASLNAMEDPYEVNVDRCIFSNNTINESDSDTSYTPSAGALYIDKANKLKLSNSMFVSNVFSANIASTVYGGAAFVNTGGADVLNCTFYNNKLTNSNSSGSVKGIAVGIYGSDSVPANLYNNIMIGNTANGLDSTYFTNNGTDGYAAFNQSNNLLIGTASNIFTDAASGNFTLNSTATDAIDKGNNINTFGSYDLAGNNRIINSTVDLGAYECKAAAPTVCVSGNPTTWTNSDVTLTITASDSSSGLNTAGAYSFDDGSTWTTSNSKRFSANGTVNIKVRNNAGNISSQSIVIDKIDKAVPTITSVTANTADWTSSDVTLTVNASDALSGLAATAYSFDGGSTWQTENTRAYSSNTSNIVVKVKDAADNIATYSPIDITKIDKTAPNAAVIVGSAKYTVNNWYNNPQTIAASFTATEGCEERLQFKVNNGSWNGSWSDGTGVIISGEGKYDVSCRVIDSLGRASAEQTVKVNVDKTVPTITSVTGNPSDWTSGDVILTVNANDTLSGLAAAAYSFDGGSTWQAQNTKTFADNTSNIEIKVKDAAGNVAAYGSIINITNIDKTAPNTAVIANSDRYTVNNWYNSAQTITASFTATAGYAEKLQYQVNGGAWTDGESVSVSAEGKHDVSYRVIDSLGRASAEQTVKVNIDKTAPTNAKITVKDREFTSLLNKITFGIFFKETVNVSITADDNESGIKSIQYQKVAKDMDYNPNGTWVSGSSFDVNPDEGFVVYAKVADNAGNSLVINSDGVVVDATKPALTLTPGVSNWTNSNVNVKVNASDALAGVKNVTYTTNETTPQVGTVAISSGEGNITLNNEGQYLLTVTANDNSDNEVTQTANIKIDKTVPTITAVTPNTSDWTSNDVTLTVNANDGLSGLAAYSFDGGSTWQAQNTKTFADNTSNIEVKVKDAAGNVAAYGSIINITNIDKTAPNTAVIANSDKYTAGNWYKDAQTITASFTATAGCAEKLQYKVNDGAWTDGASVSVSTEGKHDVSYRVIDSSNRTSTAQTVKVNVDNTVPTQAKITIKDREFTSILNKITFGIFFKETVNVSITADGNISGIKTIEYQKLTKDSDYNPNGTWTSGSSFNVKPDDKFIVYARITDNAGNYVVVNSDGIVVDSTNPDLALTPDVSSWTSSDVNVKVETSDKLAGIKEVTYTTDEKVPQAGIVAISEGKGTIKLSNEGQYKLTVTAKDNSLNEVSQNIDIKIDRTIPKLTGAADASSCFIGRVIKITDDLGEIASSTYKKDATDEISFDNKALFDKPGKYTLTLKDKAGNVAKLSFEIKAMPKVEDVIYTADSKALIDSIRAEFNSHSDLPEPYNTNTDNEIKALEARYAKLHKQIMDIKAETSVIKGKIDVLPKGIDGLIGLKKEIQEEYNKIAGDTSTLTKEQKLTLEKEAEYLKQQLDIIAQLQSQIDAVKIRASSIDTKVDGLISKEGSIKEILTDVDKLTKEQKNILQPQIDILNGLVEKINILKEEVETVKGMINKLPLAAKVTKDNLEQLTKTENIYSKLTNEQKNLVGDYNVKWLNDCLDVLRKLMLHNEENDLTVTGIDGTSFDSDVYLVVTPIKTDSTNASITAKFVISAENVKKAAETTSEIKNKELVALYDVSLFKDNVKVQPDGKVKVKIKVPEDLKARTGLDIVHIADDGTVTPMHAVVEGEYLVFITTHFSEYAIVAQSVDKTTTAATANTTTNKNTIPKTGSAVDFNTLMILGIISTLTGLVVVRRQKRKA
jgi:hypothetical protein